MAMMSPTAIDITAKLNAAAKLYEGDGTVLNEWYSKEEYVKRRVYFLSQHQAFKGVTQLFPLVKADTELVFTADQKELSVQWVRLKEIENNIDPLLPFPTTINTQTVNGFRDYTAGEWNQEPEPMAPVASAEFQDSEDSDPELPAQQTPSAAQSGVAPGPLYRPEQGIGSLSGRAISTPVKSQGKRPWAPADEDEFAIESDTESDSSEPPPPKRQKKVHFQNNADDTTSSKTPSPKLKLKGTMKIARSDIPKGLAVPTNKIQKEKKPPSSRTSSTKRNTKAPAAPAAAYPHAVLNRIATGQILPRSRDQAIQAAALRKQTLLDEYTTHHPNPRAHPDISPEWHEPLNYSAAERAGLDDDAGPVRCICGSSDERAGDWVMCSTAACGVWQHIRCVGEAAEEAVRADKDYFCQVCDPFANRRVLRGVRAAQKNKGGYWWVQPFEA